MQNINRVLLTGNLTKDPELKDYNGTKVCSMRLAVNNRVKVSGEWTDKACYFDITAFGAQAENCAKYLGQGRPIAVDGRLDWREWETEGGGKRQAVSVLASTVQFLDDGKREESSSASQGAPVSPPAEEDDIPF